MINRIVYLSTPSYACRSSIISSYDRHKVYYSLPSYPGTYPIKLQPLVPLRLDNNLTRPLRSTTASIDANATHKPQIAIFVYCSSITSTKVAYLSSSSHSLRSYESSTHHCIIGQRPPLHYNLKSRPPLQELWGNRISLFLLSSRPYRQTDIPLTKVPQLPTPNG